MLEIADISALSRFVPVFVGHLLIAVSLLPDTIAFADVLLRHLVPVFGMVQETPPALHRFDTPALILGRAGVWIGRQELAEGCFGLFHSHAGIIRQPWNRSLNNPVLIGQGEHSHPNNLSGWILTPDR